MPKDPAELQELAWKLVDEIICEGTMTLQSGKCVPISPQDIVRIAQWLATTKARKPQLVNPPEDFNLKESSGGDDADTKS